MRVREGAVVAAESAGLDIDQAVLDCAARAVAGTRFHGPHDFNFIVSYRFAGKAGTD